MEEDLRTGDQSWWNPKCSSIISCSAATVEIQGRRRARYCKESGSASTCESSITSDQETLKFQSIMPSFTSLSSPSSSPTIWTQALLNNGGRHESNFHAMLQEDDLGSRPCMRPESDLFADSDPLSDGMNQHNFGSSYKCPSTTTLQEMLETERQQLMYDNDRVMMNCYGSPDVAPAAAPYGGSSNEPWQSWWAKFSHHLQESSLPKEQFSSNGQLQFTNNAPFWNASAAAAASTLNELRSAVLCTSLMPPEFAKQPRSESSNLTSSEMNKAIRVLQDSCSSSSTQKTGSNKPPIKKPRIETPSPLPTFKVRKEKLGDRITALQQLVSPFGKTDTASVLQEAIEYIKFLHDQVGVLSSPYLKKTMQQSKVSDKVRDYDEVAMAMAMAQDLRSRGLCLVPMTSTYPVAGDTTADLWHHHIHNLPSEGPINY